MGACLSSSKNTDGAQPQQPGADGSKPAAQVLAANPGSVQFGFDSGFEKHYKLEDELGRGQYGITFRCTSRTTKEQFAAKKIQKSSLTDQQAIDDVVREVQILKVLKGKPNNVEYFGAYEDEKEVVMVLELCKGGELFKRLLAKGKYSERDASRIMRQILSAVADCHVHGIIHRDLKPENFLYLDATEDSLLKVTDFGLSEFFSLQNNKPFNDIAGSAFYVAPEVLRRKYGPAADLWSCGVIMYILLTGEVPFWGPTEAAIFKQVQRGQLDLTRTACKRLTRESKELMLSMLNRDPAARFSAAKALSHPWISLDGVAPSAPLDIKIMQNMQRFAGYNNVKKAILVEVAKTFDPKDIEHLQKQFALMDVDKSGTITIEEMIRAMTTFRTGEDGKPVYDAQQVREIMQTMDVDNNGEIDYMEFVAASMSAYQMSHGLTPAASKAWQKRVRLVFDKIDDDGNGYITAEELTKMMGDTEHVAQLIKDADKNGDGMIDYQEFLEILRETTRAGTKAPGLAELAK